MLWYFRRSRYFQRLEFPNSHESVELWPTYFIEQALIQSGRSIFDNQSQWNQSQGIHGCCIQWIKFSDYLTYLPHSRQYEGITWLHLDRWKALTSWDTTISYVWVHSSKFMNSVYYARVWKPCLSLNKETREPCIYKCMDPPQMYLDWNETPESIHDSMIKIMFNIQTKCFQERFSISNTVIPYAFVSVVTWTMSCGLNQQHKYTRYFEGCSGAGIWNVIKIHYERQQWK